MDVMQGDEDPDFLAPTETPLTRGLSSGHVLLDRPRKRSQSNNYQPQPVLSESERSSSNRSTSATAVSPIAVPSTLNIPDQERIPSLSRSEISRTDTSGAASTPEGPTRVVAVATPMSDGGEEEYEGGPGAGDQWDEANRQGEEATFEYRNDEGYDDHRLFSYNGGYASPAKSEAFSPFKPNATQSLSTPGAARAFIDSTSVQTVLQDVTTFRQDSPVTMPFTPSPLTASSKAGDFTTPRASLADAERRKNHVLAVLSSTGLPSRSIRGGPKGTPHPLRRVSMAPASESITEEGSPTSLHHGFVTTPGARTQLSIDATQTASANTSFVSIASSADLTSDRRATNMHHRFSRGNISFPTILLPTNAAVASPGGSLKGLSDHRADGVKIHKHLNAMNKQLLEANGDLAREAEAYRDEVDRLRGMLRDNGLEVEEVDVIAQLQACSPSGSQLPHGVQRWQKGSDSSGDIRHNRSAQQADLDRQDHEPSGRRSSRASMTTSAHDLLEGLDPEEHAAIMQEMAERLESLEEGLNDKDQVIHKLQEELEAVRPGGDSDLQDRLEELNQELEEAERARTTLHSEFALKTEQHAKRFGEICSGFEEQVKGLEGQLASAKGETERFRSDKLRLEAWAATHGSDAREREWRMQISSLESDLSRAREETRVKLVEVENLRRNSAAQQEERREMEMNAETARSRIAGLEAQLETPGELEDAKTAQQNAEEDLAELRQVNGDQEAELERQYEQIEELSRKIQEYETELEAVANDHQQANDELTSKIDWLQQALQDANDNCSEKEADLQVAIGKLAAGDLHRSHRSTASSSMSRDGEGDDAGRLASTIKAMEEQMEEAFREIGRLKHELSASPHRKSALEVRDSRIKALEREKAALTDRLASTQASSATPAPVHLMQTAGSPFNRPTPFVNKALAALRTPKTPGPLKDVRA